MTTFAGLPAHVLLVHAIVVLAPLTALLAILCAVWPAARQRLVWLVVALAAITLVLTPVTTDAGEWLQRQVGRSPEVHQHAELGDTMVYVAVALLVAAVLLAAIHLRQSRGHSIKPLVTWTITAVVIVIGTATVAQVYRIGDSGARASWDGRVGSSTTAGIP